MTTSVLDIIRKHAGTAASDARKAALLELSPQIKTKMQAVLSVTGVYKSKIDGQVGEYTSAAVDLVDEIMSRLDAIEVEGEAGSPDNGKVSKKLASSPKPPE